MKKGLYISQVTLQNNREWQKDGVEGGKNEIYNDIERG